MSPVLDLPKTENEYYDPSIRYDLHEELVFVFGSNMAGRHGKSAARTALIHYGAKYGLGVGFSGNSYAIPTKDQNIQTLLLSKIKPYIEDFVKVSQESGKKFFVTAVGTGLAGYRHQDIAPLFNGAKNCWFPRNWEIYLK